MNWRAFIASFAMIFVAEMGDKTQLAAMTLASETKRPLEVFFGTALALVCVSAIGVGVGTVLAHYVPLEWVKRGAAIVFIIIGVLMLLGKL